MLGTKQGLSGNDHYKDIIGIRKECEKITCAPLPKSPDQTDAI